MAPHSYWHQPQLFLTTRWQPASPLQLGICGTGAKTRSRICGWGVPTGTGIHSLSWPRPEPSQLEGNWLKSREISPALGERRSPHTGPVLI